MSHKRVFIDFETNKAGDIFLVGVHWNEVFQQIVLHEGLVGAAEARDLECLTMNEFTDKLLSLSTNIPMTLCAYTRAEAHVLANFFGGNQSQLSGLHYCDLHKAGKKWVNRFKHTEFNNLRPFRIGSSAYDQRRQKWSLASIMRVTDYTAPSDYAPGKTTQRINSVINALDKKGGDFEKLSRTNKAKFTKLLKHNEFDVLALIQLYDQIQSSDPRLIEHATQKITAITNNDRETSDEC